MLNRILIARAILREKFQTFKPSIIERRDCENDGEDSGGVWLDEGEGEEDNGGILLSPKQLVQCGL